ncbi:SIR2 family NAD-dependent protein deacylase [Saccharothrix algeriensis]|uniref:protein acetyllysine N-acetyltransferase n=1 Tax=Saccharothrix algeriensis TaxID=173560 RepID=A0A8T8HZP0_9PSEU|nr:Sir2 family NAD-dependent protein deacetylase [Saccharothrix algeriensis]MBM7809540.1 NAD-dependent deacetylase [Saccharothrix algeriensis]QTR03857.1 Sir2 family NAD-dependent protein deacetylase [Saccharothrix algeriensis]
MDAREAMAAARRITALTGAGVSTDSGIPDFRGPSGPRPSPDREPTPDDYLAKPAVRRAVWQARLRSPVWAAVPNAAHRALVELERAGRLRALLTQNVDGLHQRAGSAAVVELHGSLSGTVCAVCGAPGSMAAALERVRAGERDPRCRLCGGVLRSTALAFGQPVDPEVLRAARAAAVDCDLVLVAGTSLLVEPAAGLVALAARAGAAVVICNAEPTPCDGSAAAVVRGPVGRSLPELAAVPVAVSAPVRTWGDPSTW